MAKENLLIVISNDNLDTILKFPFLYGGVSLPREYWKRVHIMFWGASIKTLKNELVLQEKVKELLEVGVEFSSCIVCVEEYGVLEQLESLGIICNHTGELLTTALKDDKHWAMFTV